MAKSVATPPATGLVRYYPGMRAYRCLNNSNIGMITTIVPFTSEFRPVLRILGCKNLSCNNTSKVEGGSVVYQNKTQSGAKNDRPALKAMLTDMRIRKFDVVVVWKLASRRSTAVQKCSSIVTLLS
jgi:hypothetical protein